MNLYLAVSLGKTALCPLAKNFLRATAIAEGVPTVFSFGGSEEISLSSGKVFSQGEALLREFDGFLASEEISPAAAEALERLREWLISSKGGEGTYRFAFPLEALLQEVRRQSLFYTAQEKASGFEEFWEMWTKYYLLPQAFDITGVSIINEVNQSEAGDYLQAHNKAGMGVRSVDNAIVSLLRTLPLDVERILDIGSGPGYVNRNIPPDYSVLAMDIEQDILRGNVRQTCVGDIMDIPLADRSVDLVVACDLLEHLPDSVLEQGLKELMRVSRKYIYLQVPFQEDPLMAIARCPHCGCVWHVNHHKHSFGQREVVELLPKEWVPVCVNYTGDMSDLRTGIHELTLAERLDWKIYGVSGAVCPNCGAQSTTQGENERKLLSRIAGFDTEFPFPIYTEIGVLFCRAGQEAQLQDIPISEDKPLRRWRNVLLPTDRACALDVYTGAELLPQIYTAGCSMCVTEEGYHFTRDESEERAWVAFSFPPLQPPYSGIKVTGKISAPVGTVSVAMLDGSGQECYLQDWQWGGQKAVFQCPREIQCCPTYLKLYFTAQELSVYEVRMTGGPDAPYFCYDRPGTQLFVFQSGKIRYQLLCPDSNGLCFSHAPEAWLRMSGEVGLRRKRALNRFAQIMNGDVYSLAGEEQDNRHFIRENVPSMYYLAMQTVGGFSAAPSNELCYLTSHPEATLFDTSFASQLCAGKQYGGSDQRFLIMCSLLVEDRLFSGLPFWGRGENGCASAMDHRSILTSSLFKEDVLSVYGSAPYGIRYRIKMRSMSAVIRIERKVKGWLHRHRRVYQFLTSLGVKRLYVSLRRRGKK